MPQPNNSPLGNYLRTYRKRAGLSLRELGQLLGYADEGAVLRHERNETIPPLLMALGYQTVFKMPLADLLPGIHQTVEDTMEMRLVRFEEELREKNLKGKRGHVVAQKQAWLAERRSMFES